MYTLYLEFPIQILMLDITTLVRKFTDRYGKNVANNVSSEFDRLSSWYLVLNFESSVIPRERLGVDKEKYVQMDHTFQDREWYHV